MAAVDDADLETLAIEWIIKQVRGRRHMKNTLPIEGAMSVPLEWAESLIGYYSTPPPTADLVALVREIAEDDPWITNKYGNAWCRFCNPTDSTLMEWKHYEWCLWVRARAIVARLDGGTT